MFVDGSLSGGRPGTPVLKLLEYKTNSMVLRDRVESIRSSASASAT